MQINDTTKGLVFTLNLSELKGMTNKIENLTNKKSKTI